MILTIRQGDIYWVDFGKPERSGPGYKHPLVVIQTMSSTRARSISRLREVINGVKY
jgi:mRNA interferase MazF